jgi:type I restriction enzyme S subunit
MELKQGYKQTEVGRIPVDWEVKKIRDVCTLINGRGFKPHEWGKFGLPIIRIQNLNGSGDFNYYSGSYNPKILVENGQLLFAWSGSRGTSFGPYLWNGGRALLNYHTWKVVVNESEATTHFFFHALRNLTSYIEDKAHGASALVHTQKGEMEHFSLLIPPISAQRTLAGALSDVDALISAFDQLIAKKRDLKQAAMQQLLTGKQRLPGFESKPGFKQTEAGVVPKDWEVAKLSAVCSMKSGLGITSTNIDQFSEYPCYGGNGLRGYTKDFTHDGSYALIGRQGALCGNVLGVKGKFFASEHAIVVSSLAQTDILWLTIVLCRMRLNQYSESSAQPGLSVSKLLSLDLALPSTKTEQIAIATILTDMDAELAALETRRDKTRALKQGMMQELLTGKTRLV